MRELKVKFGTYFDRETEDHYEVMWVTLDDTIFENIMFLINENHYEQTIEDVEQLEEDWSKSYGLFDDDEADQIVHELVCGDAGTVTDAEILKLVQKGLTAIHKWRNANPQ